MIRDLKNHGTSTHTLISSKQIYKKFVYIGILIFTLFIICLSTNDTSMIIRVLFQYHEPSIRIFRSLIEVVLLLLCTAVSIRVYTHYISFNIIQPLLFQSIYSQNHNSGNENEHVGRNYDHEIFQPLNDNDLNDDDNDDDKMISLRTAESPHPSDHDDDNTATSLRRLSMSILSTACDLFIYTCITLIFYLLSAMHTLQSSSSSTTTTAVIPSETYHPPSRMLVGIAKIAAPTFPLLLFLFCTIRCIQCYQQYKEFYVILSYTIYAPFCNVTFRDGMIVRAKNINMTNHYFFPLYHSYSLRSFCCNCFHF